MNGIKDLGLIYSKQTDLILPEYSNAGYQFDPSYARS
jgi:hypothetical protein